MRTTSSVESMHSTFGRAFPRKPNIYNFTESLRQYEFSKADRCQDLIDGGAERKPMQHAKDHDRDVKIQLYSDLLTTRSISFTQFLEDISKDDDDENESEYSEGSNEGDENEAESD